MSIYPDSVEEGRRLMEVVGEGGKIIAPFDKPFFGYIGMLTDRFGVQWMIVFETSGERL